MLHPSMTRIGRSNTRSMNTKSGAMNARSRRLGREAAIVVPLCRRTARRPGAYQAPGRARPRDRSAGQLPLLPARLDLLGVVEPPLRVGQELTLLVAGRCRKLRLQIVRQMLVEVGAAAWVEDTLGVLRLQLGISPVVQEDHRRFLLGRRGAPGHDV